MASVNIAHIPVLFHFVISNAPALATCLQSKDGHGGGADEEWCGGLHGSSVVASCGLGGYEFIVSEVRCGVKVWSGTYHHQQTRLRWRQPHRRSR